MTTSTEGVVYQANFKSPGGTLFNIYAQNGAEFSELLDASEDFIAKIAAVEGSLTAASIAARGVGAAPAAQQPPAAPAQQGYQSAPPAQSAAPVGEHLCDHGQPMRLVPAGIAKATGKPYKAFYACSQPRGQQCTSRVSV